MDERLVAYLDRIITILDEMQGKLDYHTYALGKVLEKERAMSAELDALADAVAGIADTGKKAVTALLDMERKIDTLIKAGTDPATTAKLVELKDSLAATNADIAKGIVDASDGVVIPTEPPAPVV